MVDIQLFNPKTVFVDDSGTWIRKISISGIITTVAGNGIFGFSGDGGVATSAAIKAEGICTDATGNLLIGGSGQLRKVNMTTGIITTIAGNGTPAPFLGDGLPATNAQFMAFGIAADQIGNIFISDYGVGNSRILKIDTFGIIHTVAGTGVDGYSGDGGPATAAQIANPEGVAIDACGNVYIADDAYRRIRKVTLTIPILTVPSISLSGVISAPAGTTVTVTATVANAGSSYIIHWLNHGIQFTTTTVPSVTYTKPAGIDTITARVVSTATYGCYDSTTSAGHVVSEDVEGVTSPRPSPKEREVLRTYPNPVGDVLHVDDLQAPARYRLLNIVGAVMQEGILNTGNNSIPVKRLPQGVYMLEVNGGNGIKTISKIVKQ